MKSIESLCVYRTTILLRENPPREITQYWAMDGETLQAEADPVFTERLKREALLQKALRDLVIASGEILDHSAHILDMRREREESDNHFRDRIAMTMIKIAAMRWITELAPSIP